jgi:molecular chaperone HscB
VTTLSSTDFELFELPVQFSQDRTAIDQRWKDLQREAHPDKFAAQGAAAQRLAMQWSVRINEAYQRLKDPMRRAAYLCELRGAPIEAENNTAMPPEFLMQQIEWREALDEAANEADLMQLTAQVARLKRELLQQCERLLDVDNDPLQAAQKVRALMFVARFATEADDRMDRMEQTGRGQ